MEFIVRFPIEMRDMGALKGHFFNRAHAESALAKEGFAGGAREKRCRIFAPEMQKKPGELESKRDENQIGRILWAVIKSTSGSEVAIEY